MNPYMSVMTTFVMMMGEFQTESLAPEMANSPAYFCLFALFVFIIAMVLLNLLTGLAVSDTQKIKSNAKQLSRASRISLVYELESTLLQWYTFVEKWPKYTLLCPLINFQKSKIKIISLFQDPSHKKRIHVLPNKGPNNVFWRNGLSEGEDGDEIESGHATHACSWSWARHIQNCHTKSNEQNISYNKTLVIIEEATRIISKRSKPDVNNMKENFGQIQEALKENESNLSKIKNKIEELFEYYQKRLDAIERKLEHDKIQSKTKASQKMKHNATISHEM